MSDTFQMLTRVAGCAIGVMLATYAVVWLWALRDCWRRQAFRALWGGATTTRRLWLATFVLLNPLLTLLYLVYGRRSGTTSATTPRWVPVTVIVVAAAGFVVRVPGVTHLWIEMLPGRTPMLSRTIGPAVDMHAAVIEASTGSSATSMSSAHDHCKLMCRQVVIWPQSEHPLIRLVAEQLRETIATSPGVESVELWPKDATPKIGTVKPDYFVRVSLGSIEETSLPYVRMLRAKVSVCAGSELWMSRNTYTEAGEPPLLDSSTQMEIDHRSTTKGYESVPYQLAARDIAKTISDSIVKSFAGWTKEYGLMPTLPTALTGAYRPAEVMPFLMEFGPQTVYSYTTVAKHNDTIQRFESSEAMSAIWDRIVKGGKAAGWQTESSLEGMCSVIRLRKDGRRVEIFPNFREDDLGRFALTQPATKPVTYIIHDQQWLSEEAKRAAMESLLADNVPGETAMIFERMMDRSQQDRLAKKLEASDDIAALMAVAEWQWRRDQKPAALAAFGRLKTLMWAERSFEPHAELDELAKTLGVEKVDISEMSPTREELLAVGFVELTTLPRDVPLSTTRPARMLVMGADGMCQTSCWRVVPGRAYTLTVSSTARGGCSVVSGCCLGPDFGPPGCLCEQDFGRVRTADGRELEGRVRALGAIGKYMITVQAKPTPTTSVSSPVAATKPTLVPASRRIHR